MELRQRPQGVIFINPGIIMSLLIRENRAFFTIAIGCRYLAKKTIPVLIIAILVSACVKKEMIKEQPVPPFKAPVTLNGLINKLNFSGISAIKSRIKLSIKSGGEQMGTYRGILFYKAPDRMDIRLFGIFGITTMEILLNKGALQIHTPSDGTTYEGTVPFRSILPDYNLIMESGKALKEVDDSYVVEVLDEQSGRPLELHYFRKSDLMWQRSEFLSGGRISSWIEVFKRPDVMPVDFSIGWDDLLFKVSLEEIVLNPEIPDDQFNPPASSKALPLSYFFKDHR